MLDFVAERRDPHSNSRCYWPARKLVRILGSGLASRVRCRVAKCELHHIPEIWLICADIARETGLRCGDYGLYVSDLQAIYVNCPQRARGSPARGRFAHRISPGDGHTGAPYHKALAPPAPGSRITQPHDPPGAPLAPYRRGFCRENRRRWSAFGMRISPGSYAGVAAAG